MSNRSIVQRSLLPIVIITLIIAGSLAHAQTGWTRIQTPVNDDLASVDFPATGTGYAVGDGGVVVKSTDGGSTWSAVQSGFQGNIWYTRFVNANEGIIAGDNGAAMKTTDGGATWSALNTDLRAGALPSFLFSVQYLSPQTIFMAGGDGEAGGAVVLRSSDGGATWNKVHPSGSLFLDRCFFFDATRGIAIGASFAGGGVILLTTDGGATWSSQLDASALVTSLALLENGNAVAVSASGAVHISTDGGSSWSTKQSPASSSLIDVAFRDSQHGVAVGDGGTVIWTNDGGATWELETIEGGDQLRGARFTPDGGNLFIAAQGGALYRREIAASAERPEGSSHARITIAPNPMRTETRLTVQDDEDATGSTLRLYDIMGREVLHRSIPSHGALTLERNRLPSGRYLYTISSHKRELTRGFLVME